MVMLMDRLGTLLGRLAVTLLVTAIAAIVGWQLWVYYMGSPWTRDGSVRADVARAAPDVSGLVIEILVRDNQPVKKSDVLFRIDPVRFELALRQAEAVVTSKAATAEKAQREMDRALALTSMEISSQAQQQYTATAAEARAAYQQAVAERDVAKLNLDRATVRATVNGIVANFSMRPGDYVTTGNAVFALIDTDSFYVSGYFQETKLPTIRVGDPVRVQLMGENQLIEGHVQSIAGGITDRDLSSSSSLLVNVTPTFSWVRLAQRVPVRIAIDRVPEGISLIAGRTASVAVIEPPGRR
jgi:RND family efflux transporter MFP subunit